MNSKKLADQYVEIDHPYFDTPSDPLVQVAGRRSAEAVPQLDWRQVLGGALIAVGVVMLTAGWIGISGTKNTYDQLSYFLSGGLGGAAAVIIGATVLVAYEHYTDRQALAQIDNRLAQLESRLSVEFALLSETVTEPLRTQLNGNGNGRAASTTAARRRS
jgi:hypothetical protein